MTEHQTLRRRRDWLHLAVGLLAAAALLALVLLAVSRENGRLAQTAARLQGSSLARGALIYREACAGCHGVVGRGIPGVAPALNDAGFFANRLAELNYPGDLRSFVEAAVAAGRPVPNPAYSSVMPAWAQQYGGALRSDEVAAVTDFVLNWQQPVQPAVAVALPADGSGVAAGKALFGSLDCLGCHGWPGEGGITAPDLAGIAVNGATRMAGMNADEYVLLAILGPSAWIVPDCPTGPCPDMMPRDYGVRLDQRQLDALRRYLLSLTDTTPVERPAGAPPALAGGLAAVATPTPAANTPLARGEVIYTEHCRGCHGADGRGGVGSDLVAVRLSVDPAAYTRAATAQGVAGMMPGWVQTVGGPLNDAQLDDLAAYVVELVGGAP
ncbi:MAG: c-type cytochrome [Caldilineales bacterium]